MMMLQLRDRLMALGIRMMTLVGIRLMTLCIRMMTLVGIRMMTLVGIMSSPSLDKGRSEALIRGVVRMISS